MVVTDRDVAVLSLIAFLFLCLSRHLYVEPLATAQPATLCDAIGVCQANDDIIVRDMHVGNGDNSCIVRDFRVENGDDYRRRHAR